MPDVFYGERLEVVFLEEIVGAEAEQLEGDTDVTVIVEPVQYVYTSTTEERERRCNVSFSCGKADFYTFYMTAGDVDLLSLIRIERLQLFEHLYLRHCCLAVAVYVFNDLQSHSSSITANTQ